MNCTGSCDRKHLGLGQYFVEKGGSDLLTLEEYYSGHMQLQMQESQK
jgi:hypothetical protein